MANLRTYAAAAWESRLDASLAAGATTISVADTTGSPSVPFYSVIEPDNDARRETVLVSGKTATTFTLASAADRGLDGSSDILHEANVRIAVVPTAANINDLHDRVDANNTLITSGDAPGHTHSAAYASIDSVPTVDASTVATSESTTATSFGDLATVGPTVTIDIGPNGKAKIYLTADVTGPSTSIAQMGFEASGANTISVATIRSLIAGNIRFRATVEVTFSGLAAGSTTFTAKYRSAGGASATFAQRELSVMTW